MSEEVRRGGRDGIILNKIVLMVVVVYRKGGGAGL